MLADPFDRGQLPKQIEEVLDDAVARVASYSPTGSYLAGQLDPGWSERPSPSDSPCVCVTAVGTDAGRVLVYDQDTRGIVRDYKPHK